MHKKTISLLLVLTLLFSALTPAFAMIGDEDAQTSNLTGDIKAEKAQEGSIFMPVGLGIDSTIPVAVAMGGPFAAIVPITGAAATGLGVLADPKYAKWENWPMNRWSFTHASPEGSWGFSSMADKATATVGDFFANIVFWATKTLTRLSINMCVWAFNTNIFMGMISWISEGVKTLFSPDSEMSNLFMSWGLFLLLIFVAFRLLKGQFTSAISAIMVALLAVGGSFYFVANAEPVIRSVAESVDSVTGICLNAVGSFTTAGQNVAASDPMDKGLVACGQATWNAIVGAPFAVATFGTAKEEDLKLTDSEAKIILEKLGDDISPDIKSKIHEGARIDTIYLGSTDKVRDDIVEVLARPTNDRWYNVTGGGEKIDHGNHTGTMVGLAPNSTSTHFWIALLTLLPAICFFLLAIFLAVPVIIAQVAIAGALLFLPAALFALMVPEYGWGAAKKYFKTTLTFFATKLIYGLYLSLVLSIGTALSTAVMK